MISEERIKELCAEYGDFFKVARAIEREAYKQGQERIRERATSQAAGEAETARDKEVVL